MESAQEEGRWCISGRRVPRSELVYLCQVIIIYTIIIISLYHLSQQRDDRELWTALLSSSIGYLLPNPKIKHHE